MTKFEKFINSKPMSYIKIDLKRMPEAFNIVKDDFEIPKIIHIVGTNGKGTTGRFLAEIIKKNGFKVGHYTSPHILNINERFWIDGKNISNLELENSFEKLQKILPERFQNSLTYFEFTTLMNLPIFEDCDYLILEAGLGGEFDATNVFPKQISVFTPIGFDHQAFLGNTIEEISSTKFRSAGKISVLAKQKYDVLPILEKHSDSRIYQVQTKPHQAFLKENMATAKLTAKLLGVFQTEFSFSTFTPLSGRFEKISKNIIVDVGHNLLSAERVVEKIKKKSILIYNSFSDKPYQEILKIFKPKISEVQIIPIFDERAVNQHTLETTLINLQIPFSYFKEIRDSDNYLVFGSFKVVETFLATYKT